MVRPPKIRHSKARRQPATIDLEPADVKRETGAATAGSDAPEASAKDRKPAPADASSAASTTGAPGGTDATAPKAASPAPAPSNPAAAGSSSSARTSTGASPSPSTTASSASSAAAKKPDTAPASTGASQTASATPKASDPAGKSSDAASRTDATPAAAAKAAEPSSAATGKPSGPAPMFGRGATGGSSSAASSGSSSASSAAPRSSVPGSGPSTVSAGSSAGSGDAPRGASSARPSSDAPRRGGLSLLAAGLVGGLVVLAGGTALQYAGVLPAPGNGEAQGEPAGLADLRAELASLREQVSAGGGASAADPAQAARVEELAAAVEQVRADLGELRSAVSQGGGGDAAGLQALDQRMSELESTVANLGDAAGAGEPVDLAPIQDRIASLEERLSTLGTEVENAAGAAAGLPARIAALDERLGAVDTRVGELAAQVEEQASNPRIALAIAAAGLKAAIDRGDPFMTELETYAAVAPDAPEIAALRDLAATGVPTRAAIADAMEAEASRMVAAADPEPEDAGFFGRLLDSMQSVVKVRPVGEVEGEGPGAIVARMEAAIRAGDYARAVSEYETLPEPARQAGADFIARVKARQSADELVERALAGALRA